MDIEVALQGITVITWNVSCNFLALWIQYGVIFFWSKKITYWIGTLVSIKIINIYIIYVIREIYSKYFI